MAEKLNPKQERFCQEYVIDLNGAQAAERSGYSKLTARSQGSRLLTNADIRARIDELLIERGERVRITSDYVLQTLATVVERCMQRAPVMVREGRNLVQAIDEDGNHVWRFDAMNANGALGLLGKHLKLFADRIEHSGPDGRPIEHKNLSGLPDEELDARIKKFMNKEAAQ